MGRNCSWVFVDGGYFWGKKGADWGLVGVGIGGLVSVDLVEKGDEGGGLGDVVGGWGFVGVKNCGA